MLGHIALYKPNEEPVWYTLTDPLAYGRGSASPMAAKIGTGAGDMNDHSHFAVWEMDSWRSGFGRDPAKHPGGYGWGMLDSRFEGKVMPPPNYGPVADERTVMGAGQHDITFTATSSDRVALYASAPGSLSCTIRTTAGVALTPTLTASLMADFGEGFYFIDYGPAICTPGTDYFLSIDADEFTNLVIPTSSDNNGLIDGTSKYAYVDTFYGSLGVIVDSTDANGSYYAASSDGKIFRKIGATFTDIGVSLSAITAIQAYGKDLIVGHGDAADVSIVDLDTTGVTTATGIKATALALWSYGFLYVGHDNIVNFTSDLATWTPVTICPDNESIIGISGLGDHVLVSTDYALWSIAPGVIVDPITRWSGRSHRNGLNMINWHGNAYVSEGTVLHQYAAASGMQPIFSRGEETPYGLNGEITGISTSNRDLMIALSASNESSLMSFTNEGWAPLLSFLGRVVSNIGYSGEEDSSFVFFTDGSFVEFNPATSTSSPTSDAAYMFSPSGWFRTGLYTGGLKTVSKDWHSVTLVGDGIDEENCVKVYYRAGSPLTEVILDEAEDQILDEAGSPIETEKLTWTLLGSITESGQELIIDDYAQRPVGPSIEFAFELLCGGRESAPIVTDISIKSQPMLDETHRWSLPILVSDGSSGEETIDGKRDSRTAEEIEDAIMGMDAWKRPLYLTDIRGREWIVKIQGLESRPIKYEWIDNAPVVTEVMQVTLIELGRK